MQRPITLVARQAPSGSASRASTARRLSSGCKQTPLDELAGVAVLSENEAIQPKGLRKMSSPSKEHFQTSFAGSRPIGLSQEHRHGLRRWQSFHRFRLALLKPD